MTLNSNNCSYYYHLPCRSITLLDFEICTTSAPLFGIPKNLSIPITSQEEDLSSSNQRPSSKRHYTISDIPTASITPVQIPIKAINPYHSN